MAAPPSGLSTIDRCAEYLFGLTTTRRDNLAPNTGVTTSTDKKGRSEQASKNDLDLTDLFDPSSDIKEQDDGTPTYIKPKDITLRRSSKCLYLKGMANEVTKDDMRYKQEAVENACDANKPQSIEESRFYGDDSDYDVAKERRRKRNKIKFPSGPMHDIGEWLGDGMGQHPIFELRFEAFLSTHLDIILYDDYMRSANDTAETWNNTLNVGNKLESCLWRAYTTLREARQKLDTIIRRHQLSSERRQTSMGAGNDETSAVPLADYTDEETELSGCPKPWLGDGGLQVTNSKAVIDGCIEMRQLKNTIMKHPIGQCLLLPGLSIGKTSNLYDAIEDLKFVTNFDLEPTTPRQRHMKDMQWLQDTITSGERQMRQALLDTQLMVHLIYPVLRHAREEQAGVKSAYEKTMPKLKSRWQSQVESLREAAEHLTSEGFEPFWEEEDPVDRADRKVEEIRSGKRHRRVDSAV